VAVTPNPLPIRYIAVPKYMLLVVLQSLIRPNRRLPNRKLWQQNVSRLDTPLKAKKGNIISKAE
jgi:hypothetical protein